LLKESWRVFDELPSKVTPKNENKNSVKFKLQGYKTNYVNLTLFKRQIIIQNNCTTYFICISN
jgi:hypothetical protein